MIYGYSTYIKADYKLQSQMEALKKNGALEVALDKADSNKKNHDNLKKSIDTLKPGDQLIVFKLNKLGLDIDELTWLAGHFKKNGIHFKSLMDGVDTKNDQGTFFNLIDSLSSIVPEKTDKNEREDSIEKPQAEELKETTPVEKIKSRRGRKNIFTDSQISEIRNMYKIQNITMADIAKVFKVSTPTIWKYVKETPKGAPQSNLQEKKKSAGFSDVKFKTYKILRSKKTVKGVSGDRNSVHAGQMCIA